MEQQAYRQQFELEDGHWWFAGRRAVIWALARRGGVTTGARVLDAGCGTGRNLLEFAALGPVTGVDAAPEAVDFCRRRGVGDVALGRLEQLDLPDGAFDLVLATDVLEHLRDDRAAMRELRRVAAPNARLLVTVPAYRWLWSQHDVAHHHFRRYTLAQLRERLVACGWHPLTWSYFNSLLLPPIAAVRVLGRRHGDEIAQRPDLRLTPAGLDRVLAQPMRAEAAVIARGGRLPAGVSIGMVCAAGAMP